MLRVIGKNILSVSISAAALTGYAGWLSLPETTTFQSVYDRFIAREESRPRVFEDGIVVRMNREAPPVAALEEALRDQPWTSVERSPGFNVKPIILRALPASSERVMGRLITRIRAEKIEAQTVMLDGRPASAPRPTITSPITNRRGASYIIAGTAARPLEELKAPPIQVNSFSLSKNGVTREQLLAALFVPISSAPIAPNAPSARPVRSIARAEAPKTRAEAPNVSSRVFGMQAPSGHQILIRGSIELSGGLALTNAKDKIAVVRESRGQFIESGAVWIRDARYEIFVESLEGQLVAEVRSPQGDVVGRGYADLSTIVGDRKNFDGVALRVFPVTPGISGRVQAAYGPSVVPKGVRGARVDVLQTQVKIKSVDGGHFEETKFSEGSRVSVKTHSKDHWPTILTATSGREAIVPMYSTKMMNALVNLTSKDSEAAEIAIRTKGVVWGRVTRAGQPVAGARVEVITQGSGNPIYFNELMLPEASMALTGSNGLFAIPAATRGVHGVQVFIGKRLSDPVFLSAEPGSVSALELDVMKDSVVQARAYDAFKVDTPLRAEIRPLGHVKQRHMMIENAEDAENQVKFANLGMPSILDIDGGSDYLPMRVIQNPETRTLLLPMVPRAWYDLVIGRLKYNNGPQAGNVIGFIQGARFRVTMDADSLSPAARVIYFDARGEVTSQTYGEPGGGFLLLGVNEGLHTVIVDSENSDRSYAATVLVQDGVVASISHWLR